MPGDIGRGQAAEDSKQNGERGQPLLAVHDLGLWVLFLLDEDDRPEEVGAEVLDGLAVTKRVEKVVEEFLGLLGGPGVGPLVVRNLEDEAVGEDVGDLVLGALDTVGHAVRCWLGTSRYGRCGRQVSYACPLGPLVG